MTDQRPPLLSQSGLVIAAVVFPTSRRLVGELVWLDEVVHTVLGRVDAQLVSHHVRHALDHLHGLSHAEGTAVGNSSWWLVGVHRVKTNMGGLQIVRAGADAEQSGRELGRIGRGVGGAMIGQSKDAQADDFAAGVGSQFRLEMIIAGEAVSLKVFAAILNPLDWFAQQQAGHGADDVPGIYRDFAAKPAADIWRNDLDFLLGQTGDQSEYRANSVRRLGRHIYLHLAHGRLVVGHHATRFNRSDVNTRNVHVLLDHMGRRSEHGIGALLVASFPVPDTVGLNLFVVANNRLVLEGLERVDDDI